MLLILHIIKILVNIPEAYFLGGVAMLLFVSFDIIIVCIYSSISQDLTCIFSEMKLDFVEPQLLGSNLKILQELVNNNINTTKWFI